MIVISDRNNNSGNNNGNMMTVTMTMNDNDNSSNNNSCHARRKAELHLHFGQQMPLRQAGLQLQQLSIGGGLVGAGVNTLIYRAGIREPSLTL